MRHTGDTVVRHTGDTPPHGRYARIPWEVGTDKRISGRDLRVYFVLAASVWQGNYANLGIRFISQTIGLSPRLVGESLATLEKCGWLEAADRKPGQRAGYVLTSPVFGQKQRAGAREIEIGPSGTPRLVSAPKSRTA